jgi:uncharacterized protein (TIRG00374 family)
MVSLKFLLRCIVSIALILLLASKVNWTGLALVLQRVDVRWALIASLCTPVLIALLAIRWRIFLREQSIGMPFQTVFPLTWAGQFFNSVLPGSTGGDVVKIYQTCRMFPERKAAAIVSVIIDRLSALIALAVLAGIAFFTGPTLTLSQFGFSTRAGWPWLLSLVVILALGVVCALRMLRAPQWIARWRNLLGVLKTGFTLNGKMALAVAMAFVIHLLNFAIFFLFARALGIPITYWQVLSFLPLVFAFLLLPVTVNGHGLREVLLVYCFTQMHISLGGAGIGVTETVVSLSLLCVANDLLWALPGGLWYLARFKRHA